MNHDGFGGFGAEGDDGTITLPALLGVCAAAAICLWLQWFTDEGWVPLLDSANLVLHEAGHLLVSLVSTRLEVYGGTLFLLLFPALVVRHFWHAGHPVGFALAVVWLGENLINVARYMGDARAQVLPLIGGYHDWTEILSRWGLLNSDTLLAALVRLLGTAFMVGACVWLWRGYREQD